jgi:predicted nucleic acid-binding protein
MLVDTSIWIDFFRGGVLPGTQRLNRDDELDQIVVADMVLLEVLQGASGPREALAFEAALRRFDVVDVLGQAMALQAARHFRTLRGLGITVRKTADLIIGTWCIANNAWLLHNDRDFDPMERHLGLLVA